MNGMKERDWAHLNWSIGDKPFVTILKDKVAAGTPGMRNILAVYNKLSGKSRMYAAHGDKVKANNCTSSYLAVFQSLQEYCFSPFPK